MVRIKEDFSVAAYTVGVISIVLAFIQPLAGLILGIVGIFLSRRQKTMLSKRAKTLSIIGLVISVIVFVIGVALLSYATTLPNFPA